MSAGGAAITKLSDVRKVLGAEASEEGIRELRKDKGVKWGISKVLEEEECC